MIYILLPAYNEEKNLIKILKKIKTLKNTQKNLTVILVDDFSTDNTQKLVKKKYNFKLYYLRHKSNKGLSITMETGFRKIIKIANNNDLIVTLDSDNTHPVSVIDKMVKKINKSNDVVIASRFQPSSIVNGVSFWRHFLSTTAKFLFKLLYPFKNLNDYTCNFRIYKFKLINELLRDKSFFKNEDFNIAGKIILFLINRFKNLKLSEVPFKLSYDYKIGESKMNLPRTIMLTLDLMIKGTKK
jgi:dolichol-phosphate mannosyltransferase